MPDIRKMLEKQLENLQDASMNMEVTADCTYAMLAIVDVLYPDGIPEAEKVDNVKIKVDDLKIDAEPFVARDEFESALKRIQTLELELAIRAIQPR